MEEKSVTHPDFGELEAYRRGEADATTVGHVAGCAECQLELEELERLVISVRDSVDPLPAVPDAIERRILWNARQHAARVRRQHARRNLQRWAIAASVLLGVGSLLMWGRSKQGSAPSLDIVDALALARRLAASQSGDPRYDVNHDGRVDDRDVERIVRRAVALGNG